MDGLFDPTPPRYPRRFRHPAAFRNRPALVVAAESFQVRGEDLPLAFSYLIADGDRVTAPQFVPFAWALPFPPGYLGAGELERALATAATLRRVAPADLGEGEHPRRASQAVAAVLRDAARAGYVVVAHGAARALRVLVSSVEAWLWERLPPLEVACTGVLERARAAGLAPARHEGFMRFYRRVAARAGPVPPLVECWRALPAPSGARPPEDPLFPVTATLALYRSHLAGARCGRRQPAA